MNGTTHGIGRHAQFPPDTNGWGWFCVWVAVGGAAALGAVSLGPIALGPAIVVAGLMWLRQDARRSAFGVFTGLGLVFLVVAWVNRQGPGTTCRHSATASGCNEHLSPIPWLILGVVLVVLGAVGQLRATRRHAARSKHSARSAP